MKLLQNPTHFTQLELNLGAFEHNLNQYRRLLLPQTQLMVMVKANAYGSDLWSVSQWLQKQKVDQLGVAYMDEAVFLRKKGITLPILLINPCMDRCSEFKYYDLQVEIFSFNQLKILTEKLKDPLDIHIKIDTGMSRLGFSEKNVSELLNQLKDHPYLKVKGIMTHFADADNIKDNRYTHIQAMIFDRIYQQLYEGLEHRPVKHACNSAGITQYPDYHYDMVRLGIGLHGIDPAQKLKLLPTRKLKSVISQIHDYKKGTAIGYNCTAILAHTSKIAIIPIGYADGYFRRLGNGKAKVLINGQLCPAVGNVCMDMMMVDMTHVSAKENEEVILFGKNPTVEQVAIWADTIPYEIFTSIGNRIERILVS